LEIEDVDEIKNSNNTSFMQKDQDHTPKSMFEGDGPSIDTIQENYLIREFERQ